MLPGHTHSPLTHSPQLNSHHIHSPTNSPRISPTASIAAARTAAAKKNKTLVVKGRVRRVRAGAGRSSGLEGQKFALVESAIGRGKKTGKVDLSCAAGPDGDLVEEAALPTVFMNAARL